MTGEKILQVAGLKNGTVIDHIPSDKLFKVVSILKLEDCENQITIGNNLESKSMSTKGIIKISDHIFKEAEINKIALIAPNAKINTIKDYEVINKQLLTLPNEIRDIVQCGNPNCITNHQSVPTRFYVLREQNEIRLKCRYCERDIKREEIKIK